MVIFRPQIVKLVKNFNILLAIGWQWTYFEAENRPDRAKSVEIGPEVCLELGNGVSQLSGCLNGRAWPSDNRLRFKMDQIFT